ncbi:FAD-dependent 5-carboxymethylaminomethyl-2-thiouridine(34) oxidoreductase MnmC [Acidovorax radicis]|uniref:FAD-dependent 5-carboxymethylaminomethyl-2-thiouridine(34) oxidoreductase MnmC n=1 Tax=Acidovorax radicis TaxID=758826 RepID=UPI001CF8F43A|nr:FAD-dependent 5-carboxymethylaminomethyl-2-thiouridine(34) oxidoreductase MnmC [Acidovorax radicis]UCU97643.1 FAD-dependent 5-carboxymethylaminomethyl-2-thiouridine(34) oxidoreductase MnmC [Acidovorax radicis]
MPERIDWLPDGTPFSPRFGDRYHSENGGLEQALQVFLHGCGLPAAWAGAAQWRILETGFGFGLNFLVTWAAWRADPQRPRILHFVSTEAWPVSAADLLRATCAHPELASLAQELHDQFWGLLPGVHRLAFEGGRVLLTLGIGDAQTLLRQQDWTVDSVYLDGFSPQRNPDIWDLYTLKAVARCCHRGTRLATWTIARAVRDALTQCGFEVHKVPGVPPKRDNLNALFNPRWEPRTARPAAPGTGPAAPARCIVIGGGLAGAATAVSLARRGWQVQVLDAAAAPAAGASGLPVGLFAPHLSPDDNVFSRVSRSGVRAMLQQSQALLQQGVDWNPCGVLERRPDQNLGLPKDWEPGPGADWSQAANAQTLQAAGLASDTPACWHVRAGWVRPARLVQALLAQPGIEWRPHTPVARLQKAPGATDTDTAPLWRAVDTQGQTLAEAECVVLAAGPACNALLARSAAPGLPLQPVRGQLSWGVQGATMSGLPPFPVNGNGGLVAHVPHEDGLAWHMGSTFERDVDTLPLGPAEVAAAHATNWQRLQELVPGASPALQAAFAAPSPTDAGAVRAWASVRCTSTDRLPIVGPIDADALPGLWVNTAMGARGLTRAVLCGELLAARLQGEPLPIDARLARAMGTERI